MAIAMTALRQWVGSFAPASLILLGLLGLGAGCETLDSPKSQEAPAKDPVLSADRLQVGERVTIEFSDLPVGMAPVVQNIRDDGTVSLPLNVMVVAAGKTRGELAREIEQTYVPKYYRRLTVLVKSDDRFYFVGGEVKNPSRQLYVGEMTVLKAIQSAGDFTDFAQKKQVELMRASGRREVINCEKALRDPKKDLPIYPGDRIHVPRRLF